MNRFTLRPILTLAGKEFRDHVRSRWVPVVAVIFAVFAIAIAYLGTAQEGAVGFRGMDVTLVSLTSLAIYLVPLIALLLGYDAIVGERERGSLDLLLTMPITRLELLLGKYLGLAAALAFATVAGFGAAGIVLARGAGIDGLLAYATFIVTTLAMGLSFLSLSLLVSALARDKIVATGISMVLWFVFVLIYDLVLVGALVLTGGRWIGNAFMVLLLLNPADVYRLLNVLGLEGARQYYGLATVLPEHGFGAAWMGAAMLAWIVVPLALAYLRLARRS